jgi:hypothetical protein
MMGKDLLMEARGALLPATTPDRRHRQSGTPLPQDHLFQMRVSEQFLQTVDDWRRSQTDLPSRAEAIRRLVELATKIKKKPEADR